MFGQRVFGSYSNASRKAGSFNGSSDDDAVGGGSSPFGIAKAIRRGTKKQKSITSKKMQMRDIGKTYSGETVSSRNYPQITLKDEDINIPNTRSGEMVTLHAHALVKGININHVDGKPQRMVDLEIKRATVKEGISGMPARKQQPTAEERRNPSKKIMQNVKLGKLSHRVVHDTTKVADRIRAGK